MRKVITAVLIYPERDEKFLMLHRDGTKADDYHEGKWNGLGGKCEVDESPLETAQRELEEEAGLKLSQDAFRPLGTLQFPNFKPHKGEDWLVFVFRARVSQGAQAWDSGPEGRLAWIAKTDVLSLNLWPGDRHFLPLVIGARPFMGTIWYRDQIVDRYWIEELA